MRELNFLFWNLNRKNLVDEIKNIVFKHNIDILILAECENINSGELLLALNEADVLFSSNNPRSVCEKIQIFSKFDAQFIEPHEDTARVTIRKLTLEYFERINIVAVHLPDKSNHTGDSQSANAVVEAGRIKDFEIQTGNDKTIVVGDFNMNPFEIGMINAIGFHAVMSSDIAKDGKRVIGGHEHIFFYNPMWSLYGDIGNNVSGSYYYANAEFVNYRWNVFDQVLVRPSLLPNFVKESVVFLDTDGKKSLLTKKGLPNKNYSDHLPLFFTIKLNEL